jgi:hypothetical protein
VPGRRGAPSKRWRSSDRRSPSPSRAHRRPLEPYLPNSRTPRLLLLQSSGPSPSSLTTWDCRSRASTARNGRSAVHRRASAARGSGGHRPHWAVPRCVAAVHPIGASPHGGRRDPLESVRTRVHRCVSICREGHRHAPQAEAGRAGADASWRVAGIIPSAFIARHAGRCNDYPTLALVASRGTATDGCLALPLDVR